MSERFEFERFHCEAGDFKAWFVPGPDGEYVKAKDALDREAVLQAQIRTLEAQLPASGLKPVPCPVCRSRDVSGDSGIVHCYVCKLEVKRETTPLATLAWNERAPFIAQSMCNAHTREAPFTNALPTPAKDDASRLFPVVDVQTLQKECECGTCRPRTLADMRMILCPTCGNQRCPKATWHEKRCTGSKEVGQPGSSWEHVNPFAPLSPVAPVAPPAPVMPLVPVAWMTTYAWPRKPTLRMLAEMNQRQRDFVMQHAQEVIALAPVGIVKASPPAPPGT
ncbi:hypothetical protein B0G69_6508 [Paraburkholderia sp. RAU2J]|uniref:hypothetical protein n=1 Tax=Paraburkholderia sp. RAU2J TaxID=1938810 RepID=UPI000EB2210B|nr:hypothetical protein [Paraburkholderia sp. RAU2J]RKT13367.1 hypothetical protein B0G69_6508 [Paraburkholderia sp. RAU2J]